MAAKTTAWKTYNGIDVVIDDGGDFCATVGEVFLRESCWAHLRKKIEDESKCSAQALKLRLKCVVLVGADENYKVERMMLVGLNRNDESFKWGEHVDKRSVYAVLPYTKKNAELLEQLSIAKSTVRDIEEAIKDRTLAQHNWGNRIEATKYNEKLQDLQRLYDYCLEKSLKGADEFVLATGETE